MGWRRIYGIGRNRASPTAGTKDWKKEVVLSNDDGGGLKEKAKGLDVGGDGDLTTDCNNHFNRINKLLDFLLQHKFLI
ncbi:hypothetical protein FRX31_022737 [Thalictrum thalictroides]|uniref:Uncharacterized protein n=1 Tax=Thalictrum thalictroides TaxID=46969 RepID=A0A7J6VRH4_THATH|nr:hypothetical protein FRX31_022737 [Thalictrum thalictroides]